jgi:hypothetical protein
MAVNRLFQGMVLLSVVGVLGADACAQPRLLIELHRLGAQRVGSLGEPVPLEFATQITDSTTRTVFGANYTDADEGMTFDAPADLVERFETAFAAPAGRFWLGGGGTTPVVSDVDSIWDPASAYMPTAHVIRLGNGLTGYNLTRVSRTIDRLDYLIQPGPSGGPFAEIGQTISLYGEPVSEPATIGLLIVVHLQLLSRRFGFRRVPALDQ